MNREEIKKILPHREPMLLVDYAEISGNVAEGGYHVRGDEFFLQGHFPGHPVVPGVILCEMMAQSACLLVDDIDSGSTPYLTGLKDIKFKRAVKPGDSIVFRSEIIRKIKPFYFIKSEGRVEGVLAVAGELSFAIIAGENA